jgi:hypothetical protein
MFIKPQCINFYNLREIDEEFDIAETDCNAMWREGVFLVSTSKDLFYSFCGC